MSVAVFNLGDFLVRYPQFTNVSPNKLAAYFADSGILYLNNTNCSIVRNVARRTLLLYMLVAHLSTLNGDLSADGQFLPVGRTSQAAEGSVSASLEYVPPTPGSGAWFNQTQPGASFWQATTSLRGFHYSPRPTNPNGFPRYDGGNIRRRF